MQTHPNTCPKCGGVTYVPLHLHTVNSRLDGMIGIPQLMEHCCEHCIPAVAMLDHGNISGAIEFYTEARERGLNPLLGQEIYLVNDHTEKDGQRYHEGLIASSWLGYQNLVRLSSLGFTDGLRRNYFACIDDEQIAAYNADLICLSGCISSRLARTVMGGRTAAEDLKAKAAQVELLATNEQAFLDARMQARQLAMTAATYQGTKKQKAIAEAQERHNFLDLVTDLLAKDGIAQYVSELQALSGNAWQQAWKAAREIVEKRLAVFGDRYYLETQVVDLDDQKIYNQYVRQLAVEYNIPVVITNDAHYLTKDDADLHRQMLRIRTDKGPAKKTEKKEVKAVEFPDDQAAAILATGGDTQELETLYDELTVEEGACTGKKVNLTTKAHADRRKKWVQHAQIYYLQNQGDIDEAQQMLEVEGEADKVSIDAIDPGRAYADWKAEFWVRTPQEMLDAGSPPEELANTVKLAERCNIIIPINNEKINPGARIVHMPDFPIPELYDEDGQKLVLDHNDYLAYLCRSGLRAYLAENPGLDEAAYARRLDYELKVIGEAGFSNYFLIVWDYINWVREIGGLTGPGRGSAAASLVTFALGITKRIDPLKYRDLMFERFLTPGRPDLPDIDTDFDYESAEKVFEYCADRYGQERVCKIGTFSKIGVRQALQDMGRVLGIPYLDVDKAANILKDFKPEDDQVEEDNKALFDLNLVADLLPELSALRDKSDLHKQWFDYSNKLTGNRRNASQHASGVAIASSDLIDLGVPLMATVSGGKRIVTTQFDMDDMATLGVPKFDQLKLSNLNIIAETERLIGDDFSIDEIPLTDQATFRALAKGDNLGIFQMAQSKVRGVMRNVNPKNISDVAAIITVIRPGLFAQDAETGMTMEEVFRARCSGSLPVKYRFPFLKPILESTRGVMLYQEQVLQVCWACGLDPLKADKLRKVLSKKKMSEAVKFEPEFIEGAMQHQGLTEQEGKELWDLIVEFAAYGFNAAHAYAYGLIGYWTSYLKTHYPAQFMAATLTVQSQKTSKTAKQLVPKLLEDCAQMGRNLPVLPPSVNKSESSFSIEAITTPEGIAPAIRFGLAGIKNVGSLGSAILEERIHGPYADFPDFDKRLTERMGKRPSKTALQALAYSGAFDEFFDHRSQALHEIEIARTDVKYKAEQLRQAGWQRERKAKLDQEQAELCGNYYFVRDNLEVLGREVDNFFEHGKNEKITIGGRVIEVKLDRKAKNGKLYHRIVLKTQWGDVSIDFFPNARMADPTKYLTDLKEKLFSGAVIMVTGSVRDDRSMWGNTIQLPAPLYRGEFRENPAALAKEAETILKAS